MLRWWWFGPTIDRTELDRELQMVAAAGFGGVEVAYVYPLEPATCEFGSAEFHALLRHAAMRCQELGLRFDLTLGSGWSFGGPHITADLAARRLHWETVELPPGTHEAPVLPGNEFVAAYLFDGSIHDRSDEYQTLSTVDIPDGTGPRTLLVATSRLTGQNVKRAAVGAEGLVLDHYSVAATRSHIANVAEPLLDAVAGLPVGSVFCDSLEVYGSNWTPEVLAEFHRRRGYDALPLLPALRLDTADSHQFRADFYRTLSDLYQENFVGVLGEWARGRGVPFRIQSYGVPPATVSSYSYADIAEGEGWGWTGIPQTRWASSAAHLYGRNIVSSEIWTWTHSPSFRATPLDLQGEAHEHFLSGVNHLIGHGLPYSPAAAPGLGWFFYAAGALDDRSPWWRDAMPELAKYLQRLCWLLRQGEPVADVKLYIPVDDIYPTLGESLDLWKATSAHLGDVVRYLRTGGWDFDLVDDEAISRLNIKPTDLAELPEPDIAADSDTVGVIHRRVGDIDVYFAANTGNTTQRVTLRPRRQRESYEQWDPRTGGVVVAGLEVELAPYEAAVIVGHDEPVESRSIAEEKRRLPLDGFSFEGSPVTLPHRWDEAFSGSGTYQTKFQLDGVAGRIFLDFGDTTPVEDDRSLRMQSYWARVRPPVGEVVRVVVNGRDAGTLWAPPYRLDITEFLHAGDNTLRLTVSNTAANALTRDTDIYRLATESERQYGRRFVMQDLEKAGDNLNSGLLSVPALVWTTS